ncbi:MAG: hypothetical protein SOH81_08015 [Acetobacter sp.]
MSHDSTSGSKGNGAAVVRDEDALASYSYQGLLKEAIHRGRVIASVADFMIDRADGVLCAADFDKELAYLIAGEGYCHAEGILEAFRKGDAS